MLMSEEISEAEFDRAMARAFGHDDPVLVAAFRDAGFDDDQAKRGARLMESGAFFGFEDVAVTMSRGYDNGNRPVAPKVSSTSIAEAAKRLPAEYRTDEVTS
ncbi:hypothetical protein [Nocardioides antri]|uniref:Uncharacterized protein n=1 Tax=Nocardioides antri TaxID=2607659 RepID=A0A5B1M0K7_9ACTN|nr:hypothetical protein [Nocardioides antri]KAA1426462.1 hypothetical protein F0U47_13750 [Nocardioides antri]